jgi:putative protease
MAEKEVGVIVKFFAKPSVAAVQVKDGTIKRGDMLRYKGHTTDFTQEAASMEIENQPVEKAVPGDLVGIKVQERVRENDTVYQVVEE